MEYIAHREEDRVQLLLQHLLGTAERARDFAEKFGKGEWGYCCGMLHDIGKYSDKFQRKIKEDNSISVDTRQRVLDYVWNSRECTHY